MLKMTRLIAATALWLTGLGASTVFAQIIVCENTLSFAQGTATYHGYSNQPAEEDAPGASTVDEFTKFETMICPDGTSGTRTTTVHNYTGGPGNSDFDRLDEEMCEETGTLLPCP